MKNEKCRKMCEICFKISNKDSRNNFTDVVLLSFLLTLNRFHTLFGVSIDDFEQVNAGWFTKEI